MPKVILVLIFAALAASCSIPAPMAPASAVPMTSPSTRVPQADRNGQDFTTEFQGAVCTDRMSTCSH
ncbi:MAG: hypothetical protein ACHQDD_04490 [Steroidobacterales bacterium]